MDTLGGIIATLFAQPLCVTIPIGFRLSRCWRVKYDLAFTDIAHYTPHITMRLSHRSPDRFYIFYQALLNFYLDKLNQADV